MKKIVSMVAVVAAVLVIGSGSVLAADGMFGAFKFGPEAGFFTGSGDDHGGDSAFGIGARGEYSLQELVDLPISIAATFDYIFVDCPSGVDCTFFETNLNGMYTLPIPIPEMFSVYAGGGMNLLYGKVSSDGYSASDSDFGLNILAGAKFNLDLIITPFVEAKFEAGGGDQFVISGGVLF